MTVQRTELATLGEFGLINHLTQGHPPTQKSTIKGVGDDAAIIDHSGKQTVITTDLLVEHIHFDLAYTPLRHLGYKAVAVNVSDVYAMNARPTQITVAMAISNRFSVEALDELYAGIYAACEYYNVDLVGGDTTSSNKGLVLCITAIGEVEKGKAVHRNTAQVGDLWCITGDLGAAYLGLQLLEREKQIFKENPNMVPDLKGKDYLVGRLLKPEARKDIFEFFEKAQLIPTAMIDISDGLSSEILHICKQSNVGALIEEASIPIAPETFSQAMEFNLDPTTCALHGGEDYELLFTLNPKDVDKIKYMLDIKILGEVLPASEGIQIQTKGGNLHPLTAQGWQHY